MKSAILYSIILYLSFFCSCNTPKTSVISVVTFNIRYDNPRDGINEWVNRKSLVIDFLQSERPSLFGLQEALAHQYSAIDSAMSGYGSVAAGRDDGKFQGEMNPVFYDEEIFEMLDNSTFWLSHSPTVPGSIGWGASLPRIVTWVELREKTSGEILFYFNTHFAHDSDSARMMSARLLVGEVKRIAGNKSFIITGDFNLAPDSRAYSILTQSGAPDPLLYDAFVKAETPVQGPVATFNGWSDNGGKERIDYVFVSTGTGVMEVSAIVRKKGEMYISDHWPVKALISIR